MTSTDTQTEAAEPPRVDFSPRPFDTDLTRLAGRLLRAVRHTRRISQRDLVELALVSRSVVERIEAGTTVPRVDTLAKLLHSAGFTLGLIDHRGRPLALDPDRDRLTDRGDRHFPAHLEPFRTPSYFSMGAGDWWGWHHIAWPCDDSWVPEHTFWKRRTLDVVDPTWSPVHRVWDDAT